MKEGIVRKDTSVDIVDSPIPKPGPGHVLIKVIVAGKYYISEDLQWSICATSPFVSAWTVYMRHGPNVLISS